MKKTIDPGIISKIRIAYKAGESVRHIARKLGVSPSTVYRYARSEEWKKNANSSGHNWLMQIEQVLKSEIELLCKRQKHLVSGDAQGHDQEKQAKIVTALIRAIEKAQELRQLSEEMKHEKRRHQSEENQEENNVEDIAQQRRLLKKKLFAALFEEEARDMDR